VAGFETLLPGCIASMKENRNCCQSICEITRPLERRQIFHCIIKAFVDDEKVVWQGGRQVGAKNRFAGMILSTGAARAGNGPIRKLLDNKEVKR
jgi:hypothetical protein